MVTVFNARMAQFIETHRGGKIIEVMKKEQASSEIKLQQLEMGGQAPPHKKRCMDFWEVQGWGSSLSDYLHAIEYQAGSCVATFHFETVTQRHTVNCLIQLLFQVNANCAAEVIMTFISRAPPPRNEITSKLIM